MDQSEQEKTDEPTEDSAMADDGPGSPIINEVEEVEWSMVEWSIDNAWPLFVHYKVTIRFVVAQKILTVSLYSEIWTYFFTTPQPSLLSEGTLCIKLC